MTTRKQKYRENQAINACPKREKEIRAAIELMRKMGYELDGFDILKPRKKSPPRK